MWGDDDQGKSYVIRKFVGARTPPTEHARDAARFWAVFRHEKITKQGVGSERFLMGGGRLWDIWGQFLVAL